MVKGISIEVKGLGDETIIGDTQEGSRKVGSLREKGT